MDVLFRVPIKQFMTVKPVSLRVEGTLADAYEVMRIHTIRHLPVVDAAGTLAGIFSHTDLLRAYSPRETESGWYYDKEELALLSVRHFMTADPAAIKEDQSLGDAAKMMIRNKFGCIPVVSSDGKRLVGILTYVDLLREITKYFP